MRSSFPLARIARRATYFLLQSLTLSLTPRTHARLRHVRVCMTERLETRISDHRLPDSTLMLVSGSLFAYKSRAISNDLMAICETQRKEIWLDEVSFQKTEVF